MGYCLYNFPHPGSGCFCPRTFFFDKKRIGLVSMDLFYIIFISVLNLDTSELKLFPGVNIVNEC